MELEVALDKLAGLGNADDIAKFLEEEGIRGRQSKPFSCPVSRYLHTTTGLEYSPFVSCRTVYDRRGSSDTMITPPPAPIVEFVARFDSGQYPWLIEQ